MVKKSKVSALVLAMLMGTVSGMAAAGATGGPGDPLSAVVVDDAIAGPSKHSEDNSYFGKVITKELIATVVAARLKEGKKLSVIVAEAKKAGVSLVELTKALIGANQDAVEVVKAVSAVATTDKEKIEIAQAAIALKPLQAAAIAGAIGATASGANTYVLGTNSFVASSGGGVSPF